MFYFPNEHTVVEDSSWYNNILFHQLEYFTIFLGASKQIILLSVPLGEKLYVKSKSAKVVMYSPQDSQESYNSCTDCLLWYRTTGETQLLAHNIFNKWHIQVEWGRRGDRYSQLDEIRGIMAEILISKVLYVRSRQLNPQTSLSGKD